MMVESIDMIQQIWAGEPPWDIKGEFWTIKLEKAVNTSLGHGRVIKPLQQPHPPIFTTAMSPRSGPARLAGERGWGMISANFMPFVNARSEEHTSELQSLMRISYAVFCLKKKKQNKQ